MNKITVKEILQKTFKTGGGGCRKFEVIFYVGKYSNSDLLSYKANFVITRMETSQYKIISSVRWH
jgi:hypothetical protein